MGMGSPETAAEADDSYRSMAVGTRCEPPQGGFFVAAVTEEKTWAS
jgi:hypothetical protein